MRARILPIWDKVCAPIILFHSSQSFQDGHCDFSSHVDCFVAGGPFGRRNPRHESFGAEESSLEGSGTKSARLNGFLDDFPLVVFTPFWGRYCSLACPFAFPCFAPGDNARESAGAFGMFSTGPSAFGAFGCGPISMAFEFSLVTSSVLSLIAWPGNTC